MKYHPKKHQKIAEEFMLNHDRAALFLDMGLGKTVVTLTVVDQLIHDEFAARRALVIAPKRVAEDTWLREVTKWEHLSRLRLSKVLGTEKQRIAALSADADIYIINRENVVWLTEYLGPRWDFDIVVIDELSSFKSSRAKRWKALRKYIFTAKYVYGLTGTPAPNGYEDLWPEIYLLDHGARLGRTLGAYRQTYFIPGAHNGYVVFNYRLRPGAKQAIDKKLADLCLSMQKEDWLEMPPIIFNEIPVKLDSKARKMYDQFQKDHILPILQGKDETAIVADMAAQLSGKLLQMANGAVYDEDANVHLIHDAKLDALEEIADTAAGQPLLVFYNYKHDLARLQERFPEAELMKDSDTISRWNNGEIKMLLCQPASAGHGLNLQEGGHIIVWFGLNWSLELYQQANARLHRQGQEHPVIIHHIVAEKTIDERVMAVLHNKDATQQALLDALKAYVREANLLTERTTMPL